MRTAVLAMAVALSAFSRQSQDTVTREFERWKLVSKVYVAVDAERLTMKSAAAPPQYRRVQGRNAVGEGTLIVLYTNRNLVPASTSVIAMARVQAIATVLLEQDAIGICVDPAAGARCRVSLSRPEMERLGDLLLTVAHEEVSLPLPFSR